MRSPRERLLDARFYAREASAIALGMPPEIFDDITYYHHALRYCFLALGEALRFIPSELQAMAPDIPWRSIIGMRHRLAHDYWLVDSRLVLEVGERHTDVLIAEIDRLLRTMDETGP